MTVISYRLMSQDTNVVWLKNIDTLNFKLQYNKKFIPKDLYKYLEITKIEMANPNEPYRAGCVGQKGVPSTRLNWVAKDNQNHLVISISIGGLAHRTLYFFLDKQSLAYNINELSFGHDSRELSLGKVVNRIQSKSFEFEEYRATTE